MGTTEKVRWREQSFKTFARIFSLLLYFVSLHRDLGKEINIPCLFFFLLYNPKVSKDLNYFYLLLVISKCFFSG